LGGSRIILFNLRNSKTHIFQKSLPSFVVLSAFLKIFQNGGTIQDGAFFTFYFQNFGKNQRIIFFPFCKMIFTKKYSYFLEQIKGWRKIQNGGQKSRWRRVYFSEQKFD
jgi:hypothetical protein